MMAGLLLLLFAHINLVSANNAHFACLTLSSLLLERVFLPDSPVYNESVSSYFYVEERLRPACIVRPRLAQDVAVIIKEIQVLPINVTLSIRSGGHSTNVGAANANGGVTLDLRSLNSIIIDSKQSSNSVISVGSGALWGQVYQALDEHGLAAVGGRVATVGLGGLITGGGLSAFSPKLGFACDNVANMEVVLASGEIVNANATSHWELFSALKGGQNNFGIVTRFDLIAFPQGLYYGGSIMYPESADTDQLVAFATFKTPANFDPYIEIEQSYLFMPSQTNLPRFSSSNMYHTQSNVNVSGGLDVFTTIQPQLANTMRMSNTSDFSQELADAQPVNKHVIYATTTFKSTLTALQEIHTQWVNSLSNISGVDGVLSSLTFQGVPPIKHSSPKNSLGFPPGSSPEEDLVLLLLANHWSDSSNSSTKQREENNEVMESTTRALMGNIEEITKREGLKVPFEYINYAASWQNPIAGYGQAEIEKLNRIAAKYDPSGFFQTWVSGGFKLSSIEVTNT